MTLAVVISSVAELLAATGCRRGAGGDDDAEVEADAGAEADADADALARAEQATFQLALARAGETFEVADPFAAAIVSDGPLEVPGPSLVRLGELRERVEAARRESVDLVESHLEPTDRVALRSLRFGLDRLQDQLGGFAPQRTDAVWGLERMSEVYEEAGRRLAAGRGVDVAQLTQHGAEVLAMYERELVTAAPASLRAVEPRASALGDQLDRLVAASKTILASEDTAADARASTTAPDPAHVEAFDAALESYVARATALAQTAADSADAPTEPQAWLTPVEAGMPRPPRLPDRLGGRGLERRLRVEERLQERPAALIAGVERNLARLSAMVDTLGEPATDATESTTTPVTQTRCAEAWSRLEASLAATAERLGVDAITETTAPRCDVVAVLWGDRRLDDDALELALLHDFAVVPARRKARRKQVAAVSLLTGDMAPQAQADSRLVAFTFQCQRPALARRAVARARTHLCQAGIALRHHAWDAPSLLGDDAPDGASGDPPKDPSGDTTGGAAEPSDAERLAAADDRTAAWAAEHCPDHDLAQLRSAAQADPRRAMRGLAFATFDARPDVMAGLDHFYWAPLGLTYLLSHPDAIVERKPMAPLPVEVETFDD